MRQFVILALVAGLVGCNTSPVAPEVRVVKINRPVPYSPTPPEVPTCTNYTEALSPIDRTDPGKVAQAYVLDLKCYKTNDVTFRQILQNYKTVADQAKNVQQMIDSVSGQYDSAIVPPAKP